MRSLTARQIYNCLTIALFVSSTYSNAAEAVNVLSLSAGARPVEASSFYNDKWSPVNVIDESPASGWCSQQGSPANGSLLFELPQASTLRYFEFDTASVDGDGRAAKDVRVEVAPEKDGPYRAVLTASLAGRGDGQRFSASPVAAGRFVRLAILNNHGDAEYTELMGFRGYGEKTEGGPAPNISGTYSTNYNDFHLQQEGSAFAGCYEWHQGVFEGSAEGRVVKLTWKQDNGAGPAVLVFSPDGKSFQGYWWNGSDKDPVSGEWNGQRTTVEVGSCPHWAGSWTARLKNELSSSGRARLHGILFDTDSAHLRPESARVLDDVARVLNEQASWKLTIEGHTDATGTAAHNQLLSENRAAAVKSYLISKGVSGNRLSSAGYGQSKPVADNGTELGRAQNRRVELVRQ